LQTEPHNNTSLTISIIAALAENRAIGKDNKLLWKLSADMKLFRELTTGHHVIMGRKTFESMGSRLLPNRKNIIVTRQMDYYVEGAEVVNSLAEAIDEAEKADETEAFIIGGAEIYKLGLYMSNKMYLSHVKTKAEADTFFPEFENKIWKLKETSSYSKDEKNEYDFDFCVYERYE
jgi:dihydrofolate reductase